MARGTFLLAALLAFATVPAEAQNGQAVSPAPGWQATPWADSVMLQTQMRFEMESPDGVGVSEQQWAKFLAEIIQPRFPQDVTVLEGTAPAKTGSAGVRLVLILHPNTPDALARVAAIAAAYGPRFGGAKVTRFDTPVRTGT